jgi:hypothetical protein
VLESQKIELCDRVDKHAAEHVRWRARCAAGYRNVVLFDREAPLLGELDDTSYIG